MIRDFIFLVLFFMCSGFGAYRGLRFTSPADLSTYC